MTNELILCCDKVKEFKPNCVSITQELTETLKEIAENNKAWLYKREDRKKRSALYPLSAIFILLFGSFTSNDGKEYLGLIKNLQENNELLRIINEKQSTIIQSTVNIIERESIAITENFNKVNDEINHVYNRLHIYDAKFHAQTVINGINSDLLQLLAYASTLISNFYRKQKELINTLANVQSKTSHINIIPVKTLLTELSRIHKQANEMNKILPFKNTETVQDFYKLAEPNAILYKDQIILSYKIPLLNPSNFQLMKLIPSPTHVENTIYTFIVPQYEYIAFNLNENKYLITTSNYLEKCKVMHEKYICKEEFILYKISSSKLCEMHILFNEDKYCQPRIANLTDETWIKLNGQNEWMYIFPNPQQIIEQCPNDTFTYVIEGSGIVNIKPRCQIITSTVFINGESTFESVIELPKRKMINTNFQILSKINTLINITNTKIPVMNISRIVTTNTQEKLKELSVDLNELEKLQKIIPEIKQQINYDPHNWLIYILIAIIVLPLITKCLLVLRNRKSNNQTTEL